MSLDAYTYDAENYKKHFSESFTWLNGFMRNVAKYSRKQAMIDPLAKRTWTYQQLNEDVNRLANVLASYGVKQNDIVLYQLYNSPQFAFCYIAPQKLGAINSPINFNLSAGETARLLDRDKPKVYIYDCDISSMAQRALELSHHKPQLVLAVDYRNRQPILPKGHLFFDDLLAKQTCEEPRVSFMPDAFAEVTRFCTSGTTGTPKGVPSNNINEILSAHDTIMHFPLTPHDVTMNMTPWFHRGGLHSGGIVPTFYVGASLVIMRMFNAKTCFNYIETYGITFLIGVPSALKNLALRQEKHPVNLSNLHGIVTMGSPLEKAECERYLKLLSPNIFNGYGTTETFWNCFLRPYDLPEMAGSTGHSCTDDEVRVVNIYDNKKAEPYDTVPNDGKTPGEIIIHSVEKSALSYVQNEEQTAEKFYKGWFYTKDIGTWDNNHFITITGRKDGMIICMGENIYPEQLEEILCMHPDIDDCMIVGLEDPSRGEAVVAYIVSSNENLTAKDLNAFCVSNENMSKYMCPRYYCFVKSLPYTATGKKQHNKLRQQCKIDFENGALQRS